MNSIAIWTSSETFKFKGITHSILARVHEGSTSNIYLTCKAGRGTYCIIETTSDGIAELKGEFIHYCPACECWEDRSGCVLIGD